MMTTALLLYAVTDLCFRVIFIAMYVLEKAMHIILKAGWDLARLKECSISIDVSVVPRGEGINVAETLVLHQ